MIPPAEAAANARAAQPAWAEATLPARLDRLKRLRHAIAAHADELADALSAIPGRDRSLSLSAEIAPLADAIKFLEREAPALLRTRHLGARGRPVWLFGHEAQISRAPLGVVLVIGPSHYPLLLPGVQTVQALAAGNAVILKPAHQTPLTALKFTKVLAEAGLPDSALQCITGTGSVVGAVLCADGNPLAILRPNDRAQITMQRALARAASPAMRADSSRLPSSTTTTS